MLLPPLCKGESKEEKIRQDFSFSRKLSEEREPAGQAPPRVAPCPANRLPRPVCWDGTELGAWGWARGPPASRHRSGGAAPQVTTGVLFSTAQARGCCRHSVGVESEG